MAHDEQQDDSLNQRTLLQRAARISQDWDEHVKPFDPWIKRLQPLLITLILSFLSFIGWLGFLLWQFAAGQPIDFLLSLLLILSYYPTLYSFNRKRIYATTPEWLSRLLTVVASYTPPLTMVVGALGAAIWIVTNRNTPAITFWDGVHFGLWVLLVLNGINGHVTMVWSILSAMVTNFEKTLDHVGRLIVMAEKRKVILERLTERVNELSPDDEGVGDIKEQDGGS